MYWSNYHSHCTFCDGRSSMEDFVKFAIAKGVKSYGFSSHAPLPFLTKWTMVEDDFSEYKLEFERLKQKHNKEIDLFLGLEVDFIENYSSVQNVFFQDIQLDYLIGSIHYLDKLPTDEFWCIDGEFTEFDKGLKILFDGDIQFAIKRFYEVSTLMIEKGGFDIVGHCDKIALNSQHYDGFHPMENWYMNLVGDLLQKIKEKNLILEINTKSLTDRGITYPNQEFYSLINEMQIPIIVNSDCHYPTNVINGFESTFKTLKNIGFKSMQLLKNSKWETIEFDEKGLRF
ncbi:MAG: histidinol-phosphatase [Paludibacter sp.]|nr:histidinol-phosphatase [Paludibacter sp.]